MELKYIFFIFLDLYIDIFSTYDEAIKLATKEKEENVSYNNITI